METISTIGENRPRIAATRSLHSPYFSWCPSRKIACGHKRPAVQRHRGVDAVLSCFVTRGGDHSPLVGLAAHDYRFSAQVRPFEKLHRNEEGIHVHVQDRSDAVDRRILERSVLGSKSRQIRHEVSLRRLNSRYKRREVRSAARTRGIPARSFVTATLVHCGASKSGRTAGRLS